MRLLDVLVDQDGVAVRVSDREARGTAWCVSRRVVGRCYQVRGLTRPNGLGCRDSEPAPAGVKVVWWGVSVTLWGDLFEGVFEKAFFHTREVLVGG